MKEDMLQMSGFEVMIWRGLQALLLLGVIFLVIGISICFFTNLFTWGILAVILGGIVAGIPLLFIAIWR